MKSFEHRNASDLKEAVTYLGDPKTEALAGGTDLLGELKRRIRGVDRLVNLKTIPGLKEIRSEGGLTIGALVTLSEVENHPAILERFPILAQAASLAASPQLRHMGTVAGNLCQHPRCWYFRNRLSQCWLKGGQKCFAVIGENRHHAILGGRVCHAIHPSDLAPVLTALNGRAEFIGSKGIQEISLEELYAIPTKDHRQMTILNHDELITHVRVPLPSVGSYGVFLKAMDRKAWSFALVSVAAMLNFEGDRVTKADVILGGVAPIPWRAVESERILGNQGLSDEILEQAGRAASSGARPLRNNAYKVRLTEMLVKKALKAIREMRHSGFQAGREER